MGKCPPVAAIVGYRDGSIPERLPYGRLFREVDYEHYDSNVYLLGSENPILIDRLNWGLRD